MKTTKSFEASIRKKLVRAVPIVLMNWTGNPMSGMLNLPGSFENSIYIEKYKSEANLYYSGIQNSQQKIKKVPWQ